MMLRNLDELWVMLIHNCFYPVDCTFFNNLDYFPKYDVDYVIFLVVDVDIQSLLNIYRT